MNAKKRRCLPCTAFFLLALLQAAGFVSSLEAQSAQRRSFNSSVSALPATAQGLSLEETGSWQEIINRAVFDVFRGAELYRAGISIRLTASESVSLRFLPGGILELSSGLLDFIDDSIIGSGDISARRLRQLDLERGQMLLPFIAAEAGIFAADAEFRAYRRIAASSGQAAAQRAASTTQGISFNIEETLHIDVCAEAILYAAGNFSSYDEWLETIFVQEAANPALEGYIARFPEYEARAAALAAEVADPLNGVQQLKLILNSLKTGFNTTDALIAADNLSSKMQGVVYVDRLKALLAHRAWEESAAKSTSGGAAALSMLPFSRPLEGERSAELKAQAERIQGGASLFGVLPRPQGEGDARRDRLYRQALEAYANVEAAYSDFAMQSARAFLQAQKASAADIDGIIADAANAALEEAGTSSMLARANYARLLYLTGKDASLAVRVLEGIFPQADAAAAQVPGKETLYSYVSPGFPGDSRLALLFYAEAAKHAGDDEAAARAIDAVIAASPTEEELAADEEGAVPGENTILRSAALGDDSEIVESVWGLPGEIVFNTESETWTYPEIMAETVFVPVPQIDSSTGLPLRVMRVSAAIAVCSGSPVSFPGDLRSGDSKEAFEEELGAPAYRADDCFVYFYDGIRVKLRVARDGTVTSFFICF